MRFAESLWLLLLLPLPLLWRWGFGLVIGQPDALARLGDPASLRANQGAPQRSAWVRGIAALAWVALVLGLARLEGEPEATLIPGRGLDVLVAVDTSRSMAAQDLAPDRLVAARILVEGLSQKLAGDRMALMAFSGVAHLQCPFTDDLGIFRRYLQQLEAGKLPVGGTDLMAAVDLSLEIFERGGDGERVLVLLTDGEDHSGSTMKALGEKLRSARVSPYLVSVGSELGEPVPDGDGGYLRDQAGQPVVSRADRQGLMTLAEAAGGRVFTLQPGSTAGAELEQAILALERKASRPSRDERRPRWYLLLIALSLVAAVMARRVPAQALLLVAMPLLTGAAGLRHRDPDARVGVKALEAGDPAAALEAFDRAASRGSTPALEYNRGLALLRQGKNKEAAAALSRAAARLEGDGRADAEAARGMALARAGDKKAALQSLTRALRLKPNHPVATPWLRHLLAPQPQQPKDDKKDQQGDEPSDEPKQGGQDAGPHQDAGERGDAGTSPQQSPRGDGDEGKDRPEAGPQPEQQSGQSDDQGGPDGGSDAPQPDEGDGDAGPQTAQAAKEGGDAGPEQTETLLRNYRARERLLPLDMWQGQPQRRSVEKDW